jgi:hypothetical protein
MSLRALIQNGVERVARYVERHAVRARVKAHFMQIRMDIHVRDDAPALGIVFEIVQYAVDLVEQAFLINMLYAKLIPVRFAYAPRFVRPGIPDTAVEIADIVGFFLPYPQQLVHRAFQICPAQGKYGEFFRSVDRVTTPNVFHVKRGEPSSQRGRRTELRIPVSVLQISLQLLINN